MHDKAPIVILGGGVTGFSIAYYLAKQGVKCQVIEMDSIGSKASGRASGNIASPGLATIFFATPFMERRALMPYVDLCQESFLRHRQLAMQLRVESGVDIQYADATRLFVALREEEEKELKALLYEARSNCFEAGWLEADGLRVEGPWLTSEARGAVMVPQDQLEPYRYVLALAQAAEILGVKIMFRQATGFHCKGSRVTSIILSVGEGLETDAVVIAMGPWSGQATSWLGTEIPLNIIRGQALRLKVEQRIPMYQFAYGGISIAGKIDGSVLLGYLEDRPEGFNDNPTEEAKQTMIAGAIRLMPELNEAEVIETRSGLLAYTPDGVPILGHLPGWDNVYLATGLGTIGITLSPAVGRIMADLIVNDRSGNLLEKLSPMRFGG